MSKEMTISFIKGYSFLFEDEGKEIKAWFSALSGLEKVYVDGELVSSQRNLSTDSFSVFNIGPNEYSINMKVVSLLKGPFVCTLSKNGNEYKRQKLVVPKLLSKFPFLVRLAFFIVLGVLFGLSVSFSQLPPKFTYYFLGVIFVVMLFYLLNKGPVIEDEDIIQQDD